MKKKNNLFPLLLFFIDAAPPPVPPAPIVDDDDEDDKKELKNKGTNNYFDQGERWSNTIVKPMLQTRRVPSSIHPY